VLHVSIREARAGMVLAADIPHPNIPGGRLLRTGATLDDPCVAKLAELGVREVCIRYPGLEELAKFTDPRVLAACSGVTRELAVVLDAAAVQSRLELDYWAYRRAVMGMLDAFAQNPAAAQLARLISHAERPAVRHAGNVCVLSLLMALKLEFYLVHERSRLSASAARDLTPLGVGAMLHDVGMMKLPPETLDRWNRTHDERDPAWRSHVALGYEQVADQVDATAAGVVLHHHQRFDGTGFPPRTELSGAVRHLAGSEIHVFARIVAAADEFERTRHPAHAPGARDEDTPPLPAVRALRMLLQPERRRRIDPVVFRALMTVTPPFPPGTLVTITGGRRAAVVDWSPASPCRPTVQVFDPSAAVNSRRPPAAERIDLRTATGVSIIEAEGHDVRGDLFDPETPDEFDLSRVATSMTNRAAALQNDANRPGAAA
jgi:HD-GYP domain-containing protein (c-di-GMP phosphodiesterase class II)